jgi:class 3 adenylate cyclase
MSIDADLHTRLSRFLSSDMLAQFPNSQALTAAIRRLNSLHQAVSSFLPQYIAENERLYVEDYVDLRSGTFMFADVSGFTALSETLQRVGGREGIEILTEIINDFFARMLEILAKSNGQLLKFAGDALLIFFPAMEGADEAPLAIRTGLRMQREMAAQFQPIGSPALRELLGEHGLQLTMSIGICRGKLFESVVGNDIQRDHIIQGDLPGQAMNAEGAGERDDVIITAGLQAEYGHQFETVPVAEGFFRVVDNFGDQLSDYEFVVPRRRRAQASALFDFVEANLIEDLERTLTRLEGVARFVARNVVNQLAFLGDHIEGENRPATVIFVHATGFAELLAQWGEEQLPLLVSILNRYYNLIQRTISANGGTLTRTDPYQRGFKQLITFGAPVAHADDPERAVTTALEMRRLLANFNTRLHDELPDALKRDTYITQRAGITHGSVYAGEAGWRARREYTVMGDDVNLAARLMGKGEMGQIMISSRVWERVHPHFETEALPPFQLKGKSKPTQAYLVRASTISPLSISATSDTPFVGHDLQLLTLTLALQQAKGPQRRQAFALHGEVGVGKTRMAKQVAQAAETAGFQVVWANCQLRHTQDRNIWAALLSQLLQLDQAKSEQAQRRLLRVRLAELGMPDLEPVLNQLFFGSVDNAAPKPPSAEPSPEKKKRTTNVFELAQSEIAPIKSGIFGIARDQIQAALDAAPSSDTPFWQKIQKQTSLPDSVVRFLQVFCEQIPVLLVIDDLHQSDANTLDILKRVLNEITKARLFILVTYENAEGLDLSIRRQVSVGDLDEGETAQLAARALPTQEIGPRLRQLLWERTNGRPLFIESLLRVLQRDQQIEQGDMRAELVADMDIETLPDDVRQLIVSQIDRLSPEARALLQVAAVIGDGFPLDMLLALAPEVSEIRLEVLLGEMIFYQIVESLPDSTYRFQHGLAQTTVYETLNRLQRQKLHRAAADFLMNQADADRHVLQTAYHLVKGGSPLRGIELISQAADAAEQKQQMDRAIELYTHACELFPHDESVRAQLARLQSAQRS